MQVVQTAIPELLILEPKVFGDDRGFFFESFNQKTFQNLTGVKAHFVQDNHSKSAANVLRGLHYQIEQAQGKLVRVTAGEVFDVAVDIRRQSATFGKWVGVHLSAENVNYGYHQVLPMALLYSKIILSFYTKLLIITHRNMSAVFVGMTRLLLLTGQ